MRITFNGSIFQATHVTGPTHNYLGLALRSDAAPADFEVRLLSHQPGEAAKLRADEVKAWILEGIGIANEQLGTGYWPAYAEFVASDSHCPHVYAELARRIVLAAHDREAAAPFAGGGTSAGSTEGRSSP